MLTWINAVICNQIRTLKLLFKDTTALAETLEAQRYILFMPTRKLILNIMSNIHLDIINIIIVWTLI